MCTSAIHFINIILSYTDKWWYKLSSGNLVHNIIIHSNNNNKINWKNKNKTKVKNKNRDYQSITMFCALKKKTIIKKYDGGRSTLFFFSFPFMTENISSPFVCHTQRTQYITLCRRFHRSTGRPQRPRPNLNLYFNLEKYSCFDRIGIPTRTQNVFFLFFYLKFFWQQWLYT